MGNGVRTCDGGKGPTSSHKNHTRILGSGETMWCRGGGVT